MLKIDDKQFNIIYETITVICDRISEDSIMKSKYLSLLSELIPETDGASSINRGYKKIVKSTMEICELDGLSVVDLICYGLVNDHINVSSFSNGNLKLSHCRAEIENMRDIVMGGFELNLGEYYNYKTDTEARSFSVKHNLNLFERYVKGYYLLEKYSFIMKCDDFTIPIAMSNNGRTHFLQLQTLSTAKEHKKRRKEWDEVELISKKALRKIKLFESNIIAYITIFLAVFALIGINFNYISGYIASDKISAVILLNGCLAITLTIIFLLVDYTKNFDFLFGESRDINWKYFRQKGGGYILLICTELLIMYTLLKACAIFII